MNQSHIEVLSKKIILLFVELPQLTVLLVEGRRLKVEKGVGSIQACGAMLSKKIILLFVELPQLTVPLAEGRRLKVEKGVGSIQACGAIERLSLETGGVTGTKEKEPPPTK
jgi:hypothetical protein